MRQFPRPDTRKPRTTVTDANGNYSFDGGSAGQFMVASKANYYFNPSSRDINSCEMTQANFVGHSGNNLLFSADYTVAEDNCSVQIPVLRGGNASGVEPITVDYSTSSGTATAGSDYAWSTSCLVGLSAQDSKFYGDAFNVLI